MSKLTDQFKELMNITVKNAKQYQEQIKQLQNDTNDNKSKQDDIEESNKKTLEQLSHVYPAGSEGFELSAIYRELTKISRSLDIIAHKGDEQ